MTQWRLVHASSQINRFCQASIVSSQKLSTSTIIKIKIKGRLVLTYYTFLIDFLTLASAQANTR
jgi:hypothetical protein